MVANSDRAAGPLLAMLRNNRVPSVFLILAGAQCACMCMCQQSDRIRAFTHICMQHVRSFPPLRAQLFSYAVFFCMGVTALWQQDWLFDAQQLWAGWPRHEFRWAVGALIG